MRACRYPVRSHLRSYWSKICKTDSRNRSGRDLYPLREDRAQAGERQGCDCRAAAFGPRGHPGGWHGGAPAPRTWWPASWALRLRAPSSSCRSLAVPSSCSFACLSITCSFFTCTIVNANRDKFLRILSFIEKKTLALEILRTSSFFFLICQFRTTDLIRGRCRALRLTNPFSRTLPHLRRSALPPGPAGRGTAPLLWAILRLQSATHTNTMIFSKTKVKSYYFPTWNF